MAPSGQAREGSGAGFPRRTVRPRHRIVGAEDGAGRPPAQHRHPRAAAVPAEEIQGSDERRRGIPADFSGRECPAAGRRPGPGRAWPGWAGTERARPERPWRQPARSRDAATGERRRRPRRRALRCRQQEQGRVAPALQEPQSLQRVAVHLRGGGLGAGRPGRQRHARRTRRSAHPWAARPRPWPGNRPGRWRNRPGWP